MRSVRGLNDAREALAKGERALASEPFAACHAGVNYYHAMLAQLHSEFPGNDFSFTLCCGDDAAIAHEALRMGFQHILCDCGDGQFVELQAIADSCKAVLERTEGM